MADPSSDALDCIEIVIRVFRNRTHRDDQGNATEAAFILRPTDNGRLSVFRQTIVSVEESKQCLAKNHGAATLHTGRIRAIDCSPSSSLEVVASEGEGTEIPGHASILNLPDPINDRGRAEYIGGLLRDQSRKA